MKCLVLLAFAFGLAGAAVTTPQCPFNAQAACDRCPFDRNWIQYVADGCDCTKFYQCEKRDNVIIVHPQQCDPCHCFSDKDWSCSIQIATGCTPGTFSTISLPTQPIGPSFFCVDFDHDWRETVWYNTEATCGFSKSAKIWSPNDVLQKGLYTSGNVLVSNGGSCNVEVPYFQNNQFRQFTLCGFFNWNDKNNAYTKMGLVYNGYVDDCYPGSIQLYKTSLNKVEAAVTLEGGAPFFITNPNSPVTPWAWHKVCLRFDGEAGTLELTLDDIPPYQVSSPALKGLTRKNHCDLRIGEVLEETSPGVFSRFPFFGSLDSWCFIPALVPDSNFV